MSGIYTGEKLAFGIIAVIVATLGMLTITADTVVKWSAFAEHLILFAAIIGAGLLMRLSARLVHFSTTMIALGLYPIYSSCLALVFYLNFPLKRPLTDTYLFKVDAFIGYDWARAVEWLAQYPTVAWVLSLVYLSSLLQLFVLLLVLGLTGRTKNLHCMLITGMSAGVILCVFWIIWPSFGPSAYLHPSQAAVENSALVVTPAYGAHLMHLAEHGLAVIDRHQLLGTVAFPSFHILMAVLAVWFARGTFLFIPFAALNLLMLPATAIHGGHHLVDLPAGVALFVVSFWCSNRMFHYFEMAQLGRNKTAAVDLVRST